MKKVRVEFEIAMVAGQDIQIKINDKITDFEMKSERKSSFHFIRLKAEKFD